MERTYKQTLNFTKINKINIIKLTIAHEVDCCLDKEITEDTFEYLCAQVYDIYMNMNTYDLNKIVCLVLDSNLNEKTRQLIIDEYDDDIEEYVRVMFYEREDY